LERCTLIQQNFVGNLVYNPQKFLEGAISPFFSVFN
jgi:hypothetical protein